MNVKTASGNCAKCGYDFLGLPMSGSCPECGTPYDMKSGQGIVSEAGLAMYRGELIMGSVRSGCLGAITLFIFGVGFIWAFFAENPLRPIAIAGIIGATLLLITAYSIYCQIEYRRQRSKALSNETLVETRPVFHVEADAVPSPSDVPDVIDLEDEREEETPKG